MDLGAQSLSVRCLLHKIPLCKMMTIMLNHLCKALTDSRGKSLNISCYLEWVTPDKRLSNALRGYLMLCMPRALVCKLAMRSTCQDSIHNRCTAPNWVPQRAHLAFKGLIGAACWEFIRPDEKILSCTYDIGRV